ncbi:hypothetical protein ABZ671_29245 [Micromonospora sp. NPDC006766]|uniref:hypothetical protein n=1 Tax=Micromonospora sp. NPDC006766 TaxID=3154778 RepID=UPI0033F14E4E
MNLTRKVLASVAALAASFAAVQVITEAPSQAAVSCSGTVTYRKAVPASNPVMELVIYYNSTNGGTNSACVNHLGAAYGKPAPTWVHISRCAQTSGKGNACAITEASTTDDGVYSYYAGPRGVTGTANNCVSASGGILWNNQSYSIVSGTQGC